MMGALTEDQRLGLIYLRQPVCLQFDQVLSKTSHNSPDAFLEHLFELFAHSVKAAGQLRVRDDLAQKFVALQCHTGQFTTSDDFMKHLLDLHLEHSKTETASKVVQEKTQTRKSRKSQPKRNIKHSLMLGSPDATGDTAPLYPDMSVRTAVSEGQTVEVKREPVLNMTQRTHEGQGQNGETHKNGIGSSPLCSTIKKPKVEPGTQPLTSTNSTKGTFGRYVYESERASQPEARATHNLSQRDFAGPVTPDKSRGGETDGDPSSYTYVLNSLDDSNSTSGLPESPMSEKYQKSIIYTMSSDDDEPRDLSLTNGAADDKPQNLTVSRVKGSSASVEKANNSIKYDRNANHVAVSGPVSQGPNNMYLLQPGQQKNFSSPPSNLVFTDQQVMKEGLIGEPRLLGLPHNNRNATQERNMPAVLAGSQAGIFINTGGGQVQLIAVRPNNPQPTPIIPHNAFPASSPTSRASSASADLPLSSPQESSSGNLSDSDRTPGRKKRKRMDDTTSFRDPPEQSLPFNGPNKYRFYCDVCDTGFTRRYTFNRHKCKGRVEKHYCQLCDKAYLSKYKLKDHILVKHEGQTVNCPDCGKRFSSRSSMEMHKKQQHEGQFSIWCKICGKGFNHTGHYYGHMNKHTNTKPFWCQQCGKRFYGSSYLHNHKQVCRGNSDLNFACPLCDRKFKCELYLRKHMKVHENLPIIGDPTITKVTEEELEQSNVMVAADTDAMVVNGDDDDYDDDGGEGKVVFPVQSDNSDSNSNSGMLYIDEKDPSGSLEDGENVGRQAVKV